MIRRAQKKDIPRIIALLEEVLELHAKIRPDIFVPGTTKYSEAELEGILARDESPVYVAVDDRDCVVGYAFCILKEPSSSNYLVPVRTMYIDDLCVDASCRGQHLGRQLFDDVKEEAVRLGCHAVTLNVWAGNENAECFYKKMGMKTRSRQMEYIL